MALSVVVAALVAATVTAVATPFVLRLAVRTGVVDHPGPLKPHQHPVPYLGGVAVFLGLAGGAVGPGHLIVLLPLGLALILGLVDDVTSLPVLPRLLIEVGIGAAVAWVAGGHGAIEWLSVALGTVVLINAMNMVDGIDGLALGMSAVMGLGFALLASGGWARFAAATVGAALGLLLFNRPPARIYLGDAGSYLLGTALALLAGAQWSAGGGVRSTAVVLALLGYPWVELASTIARRLLKHQPLFGGDRDHVYDRMERAGISKGRVTGTLVAGQAIVAGLAVSAALLGSAALAVVPVALLAAGSVLAARPAPH